MRGLDAWIEGAGQCGYCGADERYCGCEPEPEMRCPSNASATGDAMIDLASAYGSLRAMLDREGFSEWTCSIMADYNDFHSTEGPRVIYTAAAVSPINKAVSSGTHPTPEAAIEALKQKLVPPEPAR